MAEVAGFKTRSRYLMIPLDLPFCIDQKDDTRKFPLINQHKAFFKNFRNDLLIRGSYFKKIMDPDRKILSGKIINFTFCLAASVFGNDLILVRLLRHQVSHHQAMVLFIPGNRRAEHLFFFSFYPVFDPGI
ncbi:hypothetical protein D3C85_1226810 [compost metagenome]